MHALHLLHDKWWPDHAAMLLQDKPVEWILQLPNAVEYPVSDKLKSQLVACGCRWSKSQKQEEAGGGAPPRIANRKIKTPNHETPNSWFHAGFHESALMFGLKTMRSFRLCFRAASHFGRKTRHSSVTVSVTLCGATKAYGYRPTLTTPFDKSFKAQQEAKNRRAGRK